MEILKGIGDRFMNVPQPTLKKELKDEEKELGDDITTLQKKVGKVLYIRPNYSDPRPYRRSI